MFSFGAFFSPFGHITARALLPAELSLSVLPTLDWGRPRPKEQI